MPQTIRLKAAADAATLAALPGVVKVAADGGPGEFELTMRNGADGDLLLHTCFERSIPLTRFDMSEPALHDIFVALVGEGAEIADARETVR